jgi:NAD+ synthase (glutamine-hydrolysing)
MSEIVLSLIAVNQTPLDLRGNLNRMTEAIREASRVAGDDRHIICFPELSLTGYGCEDAFYMPYLIQGAKSSTLLLASKTSHLDALIVVGLPYRHNGLLYNCMAVLHRGRVVALIPKQHLAGEGLHYEPRWFRAFPPVKGDFFPADEAALDGAYFGQAVIQYGDLRLGIEICEDAWVTNRPAIALASASADLILNPAASHFGFGKYAIRRSIVEASSREYHCLYATVNLLGNEAGRSIYDGSRMVAAEGVMLYESDRFSFHDACISQLSLSVKGMRHRRQRIYSRKEEIPEDGGYLCVIKIDRQAGKTGFGRDSSTGSSELQHSAPACSLIIEKKTVPDGALPAGQSDNIHGETFRFQEFLHAEALGLYDYMRKTRSKGYTISLSGGADSAACALLVERMIRRGISQLGDSFFLRAGLPVYTEEEAKKAMLHTIYQATAQSSETTERAAAEIAKAAGADHHRIDIQSLVDRSISLMEAVLGRSLSWQTDDIALQNIQARTRSPLVWMLANTTGSILIATGNRSEGSVGYCTMDGDTSGGLAPIAGIDKAFLQRWLRFMEETGDEFGPVPALSFINAQQPTAELRPLEAKQTDEKDLMPYVLLERIERLALQDLMPPSDIVEQLLAEKQDGSARWTTAAGHFSPDELHNAVSRFFELWKGSQWKRERFAVSFHIDTYSVDPRSYLRFPVLSAKIEADAGKNIL